MKNAFFFFKNIINGLIIGLGREETIISVLEDIPLRTCNIIEKRKTNKQTKPE